MNEKIKLQVNKIIVHKRIHQYLKEYQSKIPVKVEEKQEDSNVQANAKDRHAEREEGEVKEENTRDKWFNLYSYFITHLHNINHDWSGHLLVLPVKPHHRRN